MSADVAIRRHETVLMAAVISALLALVVVTVDAARFHVAPVLAGEHAPLDAHTAMLLGLLAVEAPILWGVGCALWRQACLQRALRRLAPAERTRFCGVAVHVVPGRLPMAFCAGLLRPRIYVTQAALLGLDAEQLGAVVAHELGHVHRRDPLRMAAADAIACGFWFVGPLRRLARRQAAVADLAADAAALRAAGGSPRALASTLLALDNGAPERVEQLLGRPPGVAPGPLRVAAVLATLALAVVALGLIVTPVDPALPGVLVPLLVAPAVAALSRQAG